MPKHNYDEVEGDKYFYMSALSDDDEKAGKKAKSVSIFRFTGEKAGVYTLQLLDGDGTVDGTVSCKNSCKIVTTKIGSTVDKVGYSEESVMGAALQDAFNGFLKAPTP